MKKCITLSTPVVDRFLGRFGGARSPQKPLFPAHTPSARVRGKNNHVTPHVSEESISARDDWHIEAAWCDSTENRLRPGPAPESRLMDRS